MIILFALLAYLLFFAFVEKIASKHSIGTETTRKTVHVIGGISAAFLPFIMSFAQITTLGLLIAAAMLISKKINFFKTIHETDRTTYGEVYFPLAIGITAFLFPNLLAYSYGVLIMGISDGLAGIAGKKYGGKKYNILGVKKTYVGSLIFFIMTFLIGDFFLLPLNAPFAQLIIGNIIISMALTLVEGLLPLGLDNLALPPIGAFLLLNLYKLFHI